MTDPAAPTRDPLDGVHRHAGFIWSIAELLRGDYKPREYGSVILPLVVIRRLDQVLEPTRERVWAQARKLASTQITRTDEVLRRAAGHGFFNTSPMRLEDTIADHANADQHLRAYLDGFSDLATKVVENFGLEAQIDRLHRSRLLYQVVARVCEVDLHPDRVSNLQMGYLFEELVRRFNEQGNETAGEHYTPREVVRLMVDLLVAPDGDALTQRGPIRDVYDPACGTGGMLSQAENRIREMNPTAVVQLFGQEVNAETYAVCLGDMLVKDEDASRIVLGNTLSDDGHAGRRFHYLIANPPYGVDWKKVADEVRAEHARGEAGRFAAGLPAISDGQTLFLMTMLAKMRPVSEGGGRVALVMNGSPLFTGAAGSGPSNIRRWILEHDLLDAIVALPEQLFYNTGIATYVWLLTNRKPADRQGTVQLVDARDLWTKMRKSLGAKRRQIGDDQIAEIVALYGRHAEGDRVKIVPNESFGYRTITVERPLRGRWEIGAETWSELAGERAIAKLTDDKKRLLVAALDSLPEGRFADEAACRAAIVEALDNAMVNPAVPLLKTLVARCFARDPDADAMSDANGRPLPDPELRDTENVPLTESVDDYLARDVLPYAPDAWCRDPEGAVGYEVPFTRLFYSYAHPRSVEEIRAELTQLENEIRETLAL